MPLKQFHFCYGMRAYPVYEVCGSRIDYMYTFVLGFSRVGPHAHRAPDRPERDSLWPMPKDHAIPL